MVACHCTGASDGNRTRVLGLEGRCSAVELLPQMVAGAPFVALVYRSAIVVFTAHIPKTMNCPPTGPHFALMRLPLHAAKVA